MKKTALVTGATSGLGEATARLLAEEGYNVIITGRRSERLRELKKQIKGEAGKGVLPLSFDVRDRFQCEAAIASLPEKYRDIDLLVNNAGLALGFEPVDEGDPSEWDTMIDTNIKGLLYMTRCVVPGMIARGQGHIINIGSIAGTQPNKNSAVYAATKHAVHGLTQAMRMDFLGRGVRVTEIRPGMAETEFAQVRFNGDTGRAGEFYSGVNSLCGEDVAEAIVWAAMQPDGVNVDEVVITPVNQANVYYVVRDGQ